MSRYKGVSYEKAAKKYRAYFNYAGSKIRIGYYSSAEEAYEAVNVQKSVIQQGLFNYISTEYHYSEMYTYLFIYACFKKYTWTELFPTYVVRQAKLKYEPDTEFNIDIANVNSEVIRLFLFQGKSIRQIAKQTGLNPGQVSSYLHNFQHK